MATAAEVQTAYRAIVRTDLNATVAQSIADAINNGTTTIDAYIASLVTQNTTSTGAAVAITAFVTGVAPTSTQLDNLKVAADAQIASYTKLGVANPSLAAFEAFGRGLAVDSTTTATFNSKYGALSTADFITSVYFSVYGTNPSAGAAANLTAQINYFTTLYTQNNIPNAALAAKGAVLGQIVGYAFVSDASSVATIDNQVANVLSAAAKGDTTVYGKALPSGGGVGGVFALTTAVDNLPGTSGDDVFNAFIDATGTGATSTLTAADVINGGAGTDKLNITVSGTGAGLPVANISNIEQFFIRDVAAAGTHTYDFGTIAGETQVWSDRSTAAVTFSNVGAGATIGVKGDGTTTVGNVVGGYVDAATAAAVAIDGGVGSAVAAPTVSITGAGLTSASLTSTGAANVLTSLTLASTVTSLSVNAATNLNVGTLTATGVTTIDGSASAGGLTLGSLGAATKSVKTGAGADSFKLTATAISTVDAGAGNDKVTLGSALAAGSTISLGAGNDRLLNDGGSVLTSGSATSVIDGGEGTDYVAASLISAGTGGLFKNFEILSLDKTSGSLDASLLTGSTISGLELVAGGGTYTNVTAAQSLEVDNNTTGTTTLTFNGVTGTADSYAINFTGAAGTGATAAAPTAFGAGTISVNGIEALTINSGGTGFVSNSLQVADRELRTVSVNGSKDIALTFATDTGNPATAVAGSGVSTIDASAATGKVSIDLANVTKATAGLTAIGGSAADTLKAGTVASTLTGNAGVDKFDVSAAVVGATVATPVITTITDLTKGSETIQFKDATGTTDFVSTKIDVSAASTLGAALDAAAATAVAANNAHFTWFQYAGSTYLVQDLSTATTLASTDVVVKLSGLVDLSTSTVSAAELFSFI